MIEYQKEYDGMESFGNSRQLQFVPGMGRKDCGKELAHTWPLVVHTPDTVLGAWPRFSHFIITKLWRYRQNCVLGREKSRLREVR